MAKAKQTLEKDEDTTALAKSGPTAIAALPAFMQDALGDPNQKTGFENVDSKDFLVPRLKIIQGLSPEITEDKEYNGKSYKLGQLVNSMTGEIVAGPGEQVEFIIIGYSKWWVLWGKPGEGIIEASGDPDSPLAARCRARELNDKKKPVVTEYHQFLVLLPSRDNPSWATTPYILGFAKTNYKHGRKLLTMARNRCLVGGKMLPLFASTYNLKTETEENKNGDKYKVYATTIGEWVQDADVYAQLKSIFDVSQKKEIRGHYDDDNRDDDDSVGRERDEDDDGM